MNVRFDYVNVLFCVQKAVQKGKETGGGGYKGCKFSHLLHPILGSSQKLREAPVLESGEDAYERATGRKPAPLERLGPLPGLDDDADDDEDDNDSASASRSQRSQQRQRQRRKRSKHGTDAASLLNNVVQSLGEQ